MLTLSRTAALRPRFLRLGMHAACAVAVLSCRDVAGPIILEPPTGVTVELVSPTSARIKWAPSVTADEVSAYRVLRNSVSLGEVTGTTFLDETLQELQTYRYTVLALGYSGEISPPSVESPQLTAPDVTRPLITATSPSAGAAGVARAAKISLTFSEAMNASTITTESISVKAADNSVIAGNWTYVPATRIAEFTPAAPLPNSSGVTVSASTTVADAAGNSIASVFNFSFTVRDEVPPAVVSTSLTTSAAPLNPLITAVMSESIAPATVTAASVRVLTAVGSTVIPGTVSYTEATKTISFTPSSQLSFATDYSFVIGTEVTDVAGNALAAPFTQGFRTVDAPVIPPTITLVAPADGSLNVATSVTPTVTFSIDMDALTINTSQVALRLTGSGAFVAGTVEYTAATRTAKFTPAAALASATSYTIQVSAGVKSSAGAPMSQGVASTFVTASPIDNTPPAVAQTVPNDGATQVALTSAIRVTFSESIDGATVTGSTFKVASGGSPVPGALSYDAASRVASFTPSSPLTAGAAYAVTITTGITDVAGNPLAAPVIFSFTAAQAVDHTQPEIASRAPAPGDTGVAVSSPIRVGFNEPMNQSSISNNTFSLSVTGGASVTGVVSFDPSTRVATFTPSSPLLNSQSYTVRVTSGITDVAGNPLADETWTFTTSAPADATPPTIIFRTPAPGTEGVSVAVTAQFGFSEVIKASTLNDSTVTLTSSSGNVSGFVVYNSGTQVGAFTPVFPLAYSTTYTLSVTSGIQDLAGNPLAPSSWTFVTEAPPDNTPPTVVSSSPGAGAVSVATSSVVTVTFSENMNGSTINGSTFSVSNGSPVPGTVSYNSGTRVATFTPNAALAEDVNYTATISGAVTDVAGNPMGSPFSFSFRTVDATPPTVVSRAPSPGATNVAITTAVQVGFSEAMKTSTITTSNITVSTGGTNVSGSISYDAGTRVATFTPSASLANGTTYTVRLSNAIQDVAGNGLASESYTFTTVAAAPTENIGGDPFFSSNASSDAALGVHIHVLFTQSGQTIGLGSTPGVSALLPLSQAGLDAFGSPQPGQARMNITALTGTLVGQTLNFTFTLDNGRVFNFSGSVSGITITGTLSGATLSPTALTLNRS